MRSETISHDASQDDMYSASVEELATLGYFLQLHEIVAEPKFIKYPEVDVRLSMSPTKSTSEYPTSVKSLHFL